MQNFNNELISLIERHIPKKKDQLHFLMNTIIIGRETAYRRLRKEVPFTFSEACTIACKMGISLDSIANIGIQKKHSFTLEISSEDPLYYISAKLTQHEESYDLFLSNPNLNIESVFSTIPYSTLFPFKNLFRFHAFKLAYLLANKSTIQRFSDFILPDDIDKRRAELARKNPLMPKDDIVLSQNALPTLWSEINHFYTLKMLSEEEKETLKSDFLELISSYEETASHGHRTNGVKALMYLSNVDLSCNYSYVSSEKFEAAYIDGIYHMDTLASTDPIICAFHKRWINSLKRFSTLISVSGEKERRSYFDFLRKMISEDSK